MTDRKKGPARPTEFAAPATDFAAAGEDRTGAPALPAGFELVRKLGEGGMGAVWQVRSPLLDRHYAVKRALRSSAAERAAFIRELIGWMALPEHPNVLSCCFFRTSGDEIVVFADCLDGGSLADGIASQKMTSLADALDAGVQLARGLGVIHACGYVHQDVKPQNALRTRAGLLKVADFGLARAASAGAAAASGGTPAYMSPEQSVALDSGAGALTPASDVWSWAACVLELLIGERRWAVGPAAGAAFLAYLDGEVEDCRIPAIPADVEGVLRRAFETDPRNRWQDLEQPADILCAAWERASGRPFPRPNPPVALEPPISAGEYARSMGPSRSWRPPIQALREVLDGAREADDLVLEISGPWRVRVLADLYGYEVACSLYAQRLAEGRGDLAPGAASALWSKAFIHEALQDPAGALDCWAACAGLERGILATRPRSSGSAQLAHSLCNVARLLDDCGDPERALASLDECIELYRGIASRGPGNDVRQDLGIALGNKGQKLFLLRGQDDPEALAALDEAIAIFGGLEGDRALGERARYRMARSLASTSQDRQLELALAAYEDLVLRRGRDDYAGDLARCLVAMVNRDRGRRIVAPLLDRAIALLERVQRRRGSQGLASLYASCLLKRAGLLSEEEGAAASEEPLAQAIQALEPLIYRDGMLELVDLLVEAYLSMAAAVAIARGDARASCEWNRKAAGLQERALSLDWSESAAARLGTIRRELAVDLRALGREPEALHWMGLARAAFETIPEGALLERIHCCLEEADFARRLSDGAHEQAALAEASRLVPAALEEEAANPPALERLERALARLSAKGVVEATQLDECRRLRQRIERASARHVARASDLPARIASLEAEVGEPGGLALVPELLRCYHAQLAAGASFQEAREIERKASDHADALIFGGRNDLFSLVEPILEEIRGLASG